MKANIALISLLAFFMLISYADGARAYSLTPTSEYDPQIKPEDFSSVITNPYMNLSVGKKMVYESMTKDGLERIELLVPGWSRNVLGVETLVLWNRVYLDGELMEDGREYFAQHTNGDVWLLGENIDDYEDGESVDHTGTWLAGVDGAKPGIGMLANPQAGDEWRVVYRKGVVEDIAKVIAANASITVPTGTYTDCIEVFEWSPIESAIAKKYYCQTVGGNVVEIELPSLERDSEERVGLIQVDLQAALGLPLPESYAQEGVIPAKRQRWRGMGRREIEDNEDVDQDEADVERVLAQKALLRVWPSCAVLIGDWSPYC